MVRVRWTLLALDDLEEIAAYIAHDSPRHVDTFVKEIIKSTERLRNFPLSGRIIPDQNNSSLRELIYGKYRIMYEYHENDALIEIHVIWNSARLFDSSRLNRR